MSGKFSDLNLHEYTYRFYVGELWNEYFEILHSMLDEAFGKINHRITILESMAAIDRGEYQPLSEVIQLKANKPSEPAKAELQAKLAKTEQERDELKRQLAERDGAAELTAKEHAEKMYSEWADDPMMGIFDFISHFEKHLLAYGKFAVRKAAGVESPEPKAEKVEPSEVERLRKRVHDLSGELSTVEVFLESKEELVYSQGKQIAKLGEELVSLKAQLAEATAPKSYTKVREIAAKLTKEMGLHSVSREIKYNTNEAEYDAVRLFDALVKNNLLATDEQLKLIEELRAENEKLINLHNP